MIFAFSIMMVYLVGGWFHTNATLLTIEEIKRNFRFYPKHYCMPPRWMRKFFNMKKREIPKYLCYRMYLYAATFLWAFISFIISLLSQFNELTMAIVGYLPLVYLFPDIVVFLIFRWIYIKFT